MDTLNFGWEEWVALPELGLPALKAKIDTGARTSALHAHDIEVFGPAKTPEVRFNVHPIAGKDHVSITCSAIESETPISIFTLGTKFTAYSAPR